MNPELEYRTPTGNLAVTVTARGNLGSWNLRIEHQHPSGITGSYTAPDLTVTRLRRDAEQYLRGAQASWVFTDAEVAGALAALAEAFPLS
jgi:hypothetical protein